MLKLGKDKISEQKGDRKDEGKSLLLVGQGEFEKVTEYDIKRKGKKGKRDGKLQGILKGGLDNSGRVEDRRSDLKSLFSKAI